MLKKCRQFNLGCFAGAAAVSGAVICVPKLSGLLQCYGIFGGPVPCPVTFENLL